MKPFGLNAPCTDSDLAQMVKGAQARPALFASMLAADDAFSAECVRQFGAKRAGDMRYCSQLHDAQTRAAADRMREAWAAYQSHARTLCTGETA